MSRFTKPGLSHSTTLGGTGICIDQADEGTLLIGTGVGFDLSTLTAGSGVTITNGPGTILISATGSGGSVISVGLTAPGEFSISGSPVTSSGNLGLSWANQSGNVVLASPSGGGTGAPGFRSLVSADIPNLDTAKIITGTLALARLGGITTTELSSTAGITSGQIASVATSTITGIISSSNLSLVASDIPSLDVAKITTGTFATSFIPNLDTSKITSGTLALARLSGITTTELSATAGIVAAQIAGVNPSVLTGSGTVPLAGLSEITTSQLSATAGIVAGQIASVNPSTLTGSGTVPSAGLPTASASVLGAIKVGSGLSITSGVLSATGTGGTVTSVTLTAPSEITVGGSPITTSGTIALTWTNETGNTVFASPSGGGSGVPTFRTLVAADIPNLSAAKITSGTLAVARGGTGLDTSGATNGQLLIGNGSGLALSTLTAGSNITITNASGAITIASTGGGGSSPLTTKGDIYGHSTVDARVGVGADGTFLAADSSQATGLAYKFPAGIAGVSTLSNALSANVTMTSANTFYDGPSLSLTAGTWLLISSVSVKCTSATITGKLWDGTTVYDSTTATNANTYKVDLALTAIVSPTSTTTYKVSVAGDSASNVILAAADVNGVGNNASTLVAIQLTGAPVSGPGALMPAVRCYNSSNQSINNTTATALTFDTNSFDQGTSTAQHSTSSNTSRLTCQQAGVYQITAAVIWTGSSGGSTRDLWIQLNGSTIIGEADQPQDTASQQQTVTTLYKLAVGDYVEAIGYQNSGGALNSVAAGVQSPLFMMARIDSGPGAVQPNTKVQLQDIPGSDVANAVNLPGQTWTDLRANQTFTVDDPNSVVEIMTSVAMQVTGVAGQTLSGRMVVDSGGTTITRVIGGVATGTADADNPFRGAGTQVFTGLAAGSHTVKLQVYTSSASAGTMYCRNVNQTNFEGYQLSVLERKQSSGPALSPNTKVQLDYALAGSDVGPIAPGTATWGDFISNQTFTVDDSNSVVEVAVTGSIYLSTASQAEVSTRIVVDSAGTPINKLIGGDTADPNGRGNALGGGGLITLTGLSAGTHTIKVQVFSLQASSNFYCRVSTQSNTEFLLIRVLERKQSSGGGFGNLFYRGLWNSSTAYAINDAVTSANKGWVCAVANTNKTPVINQYVSAVLADTPTLYYRFGDSLSTGTLVTDSSGNGRTGTYGSGCTLGISGAISGDTAINMDGTANAEAYSSGYTFSIPTTFSVEFWFKTTSTSTNMFGFADCATCAPGGGHYNSGMAIDSSGRVFWNQYVPGDVPINSVASFNDGNWHHFVATMGSSGMKMYVDGSQVASSASHGSGVSITVYARFGYSTAVSIGTGGFNGSMDEAALYNGVELTSTQVSTHYTAASTTPYWNAL